MKLLFSFSLILSVLLGVGRGIDLALFTDADTGLCLVGSVWWRYLALGILVLLALAAGRRIPTKPEAVCGHSGASAIVALAGGICFAAAGVVRGRLALYGVESAPQAILEVFCAIWMGTLGVCWLRKKAWQPPTKTMIPAVLGGAIFFWCILARFMENSSSWHRVSPTALVWQELAALFFLASLARALYLPASADGQALCTAGLTAFGLCLCWEVPELAAALRDMTILDVPDWLFAVGMCCVGALGGICAFRCVSARPRHSAA